MSITPHTAGSLGNELLRMGESALEEVRGLGAGFSPLTPGTKADSRSSREIHRRVRSAHRGLLQSRSSARFSDHQLRTQRHLHDGEAASVLDSAEHDFGRRDTDVILRR